MLGSANIQKSNKIMEVFIPDFLHSPSIVLQQSFYFRKSPSIVFFFLASQYPHTEKIKWDYLLEFVYCLDTVRLMSYLSKYFLTAYHEPDTALILGDRGKWADAPRKCSRSTCDECHNQDDTRARGSHSNRGRCSRESSGFLKHEGLASNPNLPLSVLLCDLRQIT